MISVTVNDTQTIHNVHSAFQCEGRACVIHNPSDHVMRDWPHYWREDRALMERICEHGVGHPDPDDVAFKVSLGYGSEYATHGCDGCCRKDKNDEDTAH